MALTNTQLILLDNLIYLDYVVTKENEDTTVGDIVNRLLDTPEIFNTTITDEQFWYCKDMVNGMNPEQWKSVLEAIKSDDYLMNLKITNVVDDNDYTGNYDATYTGFRAACFTDDETNTTAVIRNIMGLIAKISPAVEAIPLPPLNPK